MERLLALDFDGVISDSAPEAFVVALRTFASLLPGTRLGAEPFLGEAAPPPARVVGSPLYAAFVGHMPLGNRAEDYGVLLRALEAGAPLPDQAAYDAFRDGTDRDWLRTFHKRFYRVRAALMRADPRGWQALIGPYAPFVALLRRRASDALLAIATAKDRHSVGELLALYGIDDLFPADRVLDKETGVSKTAHLAHLHEITGVDYASMTFVDDKVGHLDAVAPLGVRCALAAWGYNGEREVRLARSRGYGVCSLEDAEDALFPASSSSRTAPSRSTEKRATSSGSSQNTNG